MHCSCRSAPWRSFLTGLAQVHRLDSPLQPATVRAWSRASLSRSQHRDTTALQGLRRFHATSQFGQEASATAAPDPVDSSPPQDAVSTEAANPVGSAEAEGIVESTSIRAKNTAKAKKTAGSKTKSKAKTKAKKAGPAADEVTATDATPEKKKRKKQRWRDKNEEEVANLRRRQESTQAFKNMAQVVKEEKGVQSIQREDGITISTRSTPKSKPGMRRDSRADSPGIMNGGQVTTGEPGEAVAPAEGSRFIPKSEKLPDWRVQKENLKEKFPEGWRPRKRLSPDALAGIRALNAQFPDVYTTAALSTKFGVDPEAIRRILKGKWQPTADEEDKRMKRWHSRGQNIWETKAALGIKPPKQWRKEGITRDPSWHEWRRKAIQRERDWEEEETEKYRQQRAASLQARMAGKIM